MEKMKILILVLMSFFQFQLYAQDVWLQNFFSPTSGCQLSNSELVNVLINNNSGSFIPSNSITVRYTVNAGPPVSQLLGVNLAAGASWNFTFATAANLSTCGPYNMKVWVSYASDPNPLNDTLTWIVQNDCIIVPGSVVSDSTVCQGMNNGVLNLTGWTNGSILDWQLSVDSGSTWSNIGNATTSSSYTNIDTTTLYQVIFDGGFCPDDTSNFATVTVQPFPVGGTISSSATHCIDNANGTLTLSGASGAVIFWQYSENDGASWTTLANSTNSQNYTGLITDTWYRTSTDGLICPDVYSDTVIISVDTLTVGGTLGTDTLICEQSVVSLELQGYTGSIVDWEYSEDLLVWNPIGDFDAFYDTPPLSQTTYYRTLVQSGVCPAIYSDTVTINVDANPVGGIINGSLVLCEAVASDTLILNGYVGPIITWEQSTDNGVSWGIAPGSNDSLFFAGMIDTTWYRVLIEGGVCPDTYSDTAVITIHVDSESGILVNDATICEGEPVNLQTVASVGGSIVWESSSDLILWNSFANDTTMQTVTPVFTTTYRVIVQSESCPEDTSNFVVVTVNPLPLTDAGVDLTMTEFDTIQLNGSAGANMNWSPSTALSDSTINNPMAWPSSTITYTYTIVTTAGCQRSDDITITVEPYIERSINIRNVLTANGDGYNDFWIISGIEDFPGTEVKVFNIYGQLVFESADYKNDWKGTFKDNRLPNGTYYYSVKLVEEEEMRKGNLTIMGNE